MIYKGMKECEMLPDIFTRNGYITAVKINPSGYRINYKIKHGGVI